MTIRHTWREKDPGRREEQLRAIHRRCLLLLRQARTKEGSP